MDKIGQQHRNGYQRGGTTATRWNHSGVWLKCRLGCTVERNAPQKKAWMVNQKKAWTVNQKMEEHKASGYEVQRKQLA